jgi:outer membrane protein assembly factor BamB
MIMKFSAIILFLFCVYGCKPKEEVEIGPKGEIVAKSPLWASAIGIGTLMDAGIESSVVYKDNVLCPAALAYSPAIGNFSRGAMNMVSIETGKIQWNWKDYISTNDVLNMYFCYKKDNYLVTVNSKYTYCVDLETGKSVWSKIKRDGLTSTPIITGIGNSYFFCGSKYSPADNQSLVSVYRGNVLAPDPEELIVSPTLPKELSDNGGISAGATSLLAFAQEGDTMLIIDHHTPSLPANQGIIRSVFGLYNVTKRKWVYENVATTLPNYGTTVDGLPVIYNGKVYHSVDHYFTCHDLATGAKLWERTFDGNFLFSGFVIADGIIVANCEDTYIYGLDPVLGKELWREKSSGTSTRLVYQDGVVYYAGGGDGLLHAVEVQTGKHLWKLQSPDFKGNSSAYFWGMVAGLPAANGKKGRIFASTGLNVYCYEAVK